MRRPVTTMTAPDPAIAAAAATERARARTGLADQLDAMCRAVGLDPWTAWRRPAHHARLNTFRASIAHLSADDALTRPGYDKEPHR